MEGGADSSRWTGSEVPRAGRNFSRRIVFDEHGERTVSLGRPEDYASLKANLFPEEGGPVILVMDVPEHIVEKTFIDRKPVDRGVVQFDEGAGLEELLAASPMLTKTAEIRSVP